MLTPDDPKKLTAAQVAEKCAVRQANASHVPYCLELFLRALSDDQEVANEAWHYVIESYKRYVWRCIWSVVSDLPEGEMNELTDDAFSKFWHYFRRRHVEGPDGFLHAFRLLGTCARSVGVDYQRKQQRKSQREKPLEDSEQIVEDDQPPRAVERKLSDEEFWRVVRSIRLTEREWVVIELSFKEGLKPAQIYSRHPDLYRSARHVAEVKWIALNKLFRNPWLRAAWEDE